MAHKQGPEATNAQMEQIGLIQEPRDVDPVSGNEIPLGSTAEGVRDDEVAAVSPGEFVVPEYAVNFHGLKFYMQTLAVAKDGLDQMKQMGMTGQPDKATISDDTALPTMNSVNGQQDNGSEVSPEFQTGGLVPMEGQFRISENTADLIQGFYKKVREDESDFDIAGALDVAKIIAKFENEALDPELHQIGGPARGLFQYEPPAVETAVSRIIREFGDAAPDWAKNLKIKNTENIKIAEELGWGEGSTWDASKLTSEQQTELFVLDQLLQKQVGYMPFSSLVSNLSSQHSEDVYEYWREEHQRGPSLSEAEGSGNEDDISRIIQNRTRWESLFGGFGDEHGDTVAELIRVPTEDNRVPTEDTFAKGGPIFSEPIPTAMFQSGGLVPSTVTPLTVPTVQAPLVAPIAPPAVAPPAVVPPAVAVVPSVAQVPVTPASDPLRIPPKPVTVKPPQVPIGQSTRTYLGQTGYSVVFCQGKDGTTEAGKIYSVPQVGPHRPRCREGYKPYSPDATPITTTPTTPEVPPSDILTPAEEEAAQRDEDREEQREAAKKAFEELELFLTDSSTPANLSKGWTAPSVPTDQTFQDIKTSLANLPPRDPSIIGKVGTAISQAVPPLAPAAAIAAPFISAANKMQHLGNNRVELLEAQRNIPGLPGVGVWTNPLSDAHSYTFLATGKSLKLFGQKEIQYTIFNNANGSPLNREDARNVVMQMALAYGYDPRPNVGLRQTDIQFDDQGNPVLNPDLQLQIGVHRPLGSDGKLGRPEDAWGLTKNWELIVMDKDDGTFKTEKISEEAFTGLTADTMLAAMTDLGVGEIKWWRADTFLNEDWTFAARRSDDSDKPVTVGEVQAIITGENPKNLTPTQLLENAGIIIEEEDDDDDVAPPGPSTQAASELSMRAAARQTAPAVKELAHFDDYAKGGLVKKPTRSSSKRKNGKGLAKRK